MISATEDLPVLNQLKDELKSFEEMWGKGSMAGTVLIYWKPSTHLGKVGSKKFD